MTAHFVTHHEHNPLSHCKKSILAHGKDQKLLSGLRAANFDLVRRVTLSKLKRDCALFRKWMGADPTGK